MSKSRSKIGWVSAAALVPANMIGTGAFTILGLQLEWVSSGLSIILLWVIGGLVAWCGAVSYAELGTRMPHSGGEAHFLGKIFHPIAGFLSGWVSLTVGFAAAVSLSAMAVGQYLGPWLGLSAVHTAMLSIMILSLAHSLGTKESSQLQNGLTTVKMVLVCGLAIALAFSPASASANVDWSWSGLSQMTSPGAAVAMMIVFYAYSGWNASAYIVEEIEEPEKNLPKALIMGTVLVSLLFVLLQYGFLRQAGSDALMGKIDVAQISVAALWGDQLAAYTSFIIGIFLLTGISAMIWVGPRVVKAMGDQHDLWKTFGKLNRQGLPVRATWLQAGISLFLVASSSFERILLYSGFVLQLFTFLAVGGLMLWKWRNPDSTGYQSPVYPLPQIIFLIFSIWSLGYLLIHQPWESLLGLLNVAAGWIAFHVDLPDREVKVTK